MDGVNDVFYGHNFVHISSPTCRPVKNISCFSVCKKNPQVARTIHSLQSALTLKPLPAKRETGATDTGMTSAAQVLLWWQRRRNAGHGEDGLLGMISFYGRTGDRRSCGMMIWPTSSWSWSLWTKPIVIIIICSSETATATIRWFLVDDDPWVKTLPFQLWAAAAADFNMKLYHQALRSHKSDVWLVSGWAASLLIRFQLQKVEAKKKELMAAF